MRPALKWYGGKNKIAQWVYSVFPPHDCYVEPFGGAASVLLNKPPATHEVYNDLDSEVVNFFRVLRADGGELVNLIANTPWSREEHRLAWEKSNEPLERARRFYVRCWQSYGAGTLNTAGSAGWQTQKGPRRGSTAVEGWLDLLHLDVVRSRLLSVQIEHDQALQVIERFDSVGTLFYVDPPYLPRQRRKTQVYTHEMDINDHVDLAQTLLSASGMVVLSGYDDELYNEMYKGWRKMTRTTTNRMSDSVKECLWLSPSATALDQLPMFSEKV